MSNCIHGYGQRTLKGDCLVLAIMSGDKMIYNIEVRSGKVGQFKASQNRSVPKDDKEKILEFLKKNKIISSYRL